METRKREQPGPDDEKPAEAAEPDRKKNPLPKGRILEARYRIDRKLGSGGVGMVYLAEHLRLSRPVAVKVLQPQYASSPKLKARFEREAHALATMAHPNIVTVSDYGVADGMPFLVMELLQGEPLGERLKKGPFEPGVALDIARQILLALSFAHGHGWVHRDLKPGNVFLQELAGGTIHVKILDFGLAKLVATETRDAGPQLTLTGMVFGTPAYMSPEQAVGGETDARTDLYSVGVVLFEMLAGRRLFLGEPDLLMRHHLQTPPPSINEACPTLRGSPQLETFLQKALAKERGDRYQTADEMIEALDALPAPPLVSCEASEPPAAERGGEPPQDRRSELPTVHESRGRASQASAPGPAPVEPQSVIAGKRSAIVIATLATLAVASVIVGFVIVSSLRAPGPDARGSTPAADAAPSHHADAAARPPDAGPARADSGGVSSTNSPVPSADAARDVWAGADEPALVTTARERVVAGRELGESMRYSLRDYSYGHQADPRPFLVLAQDNVIRGHLTDAVSDYQRAWEADPDARYEPLMLENLIRLCHSHSVGGVAGRAVVRIYGREAVDDVERELASTAIDAATRARLERLRDELRAL
jgi:eukaryotic-like serine/threonine-protein kinase